LWFIWHYLTPYKKAVPDVKFPPSGKMVIELIALVLKKTNPPKRVFTSVVGAVSLVVTVYLH